MTAVLFFTILSIVWASLLKIPLRQSSEFFDESDHSKAMSIQNNMSLKKEMQTFDCVEAKKHADVFIIKNKLTKKVAFYFADEEQLITCTEEKFDQIREKELLESFLADKNLSEYDFIIPDHVFPNILVLAKHKLNHHIDVFVPCYLKEVERIRLNVIVHDLFIKTKIHWEGAEFALSFHPNDSAITNLYRNCYGTFVFIHEISYIISFDGTFRCVHENTITVETQNQKKYPWYNHYRHRKDLFQSGFQEMKMFMRNADKRTNDLCFISDLHKNLLSPTRLRFSLKNGQNPNTMFHREQRQKYEYLLHRIIQHRVPAEKKLEMLMILYRADGDMYVKDSDGRNALFPALENSNFLNTQDQLVVFIDLIETYNLDPFSQDFEGCDAFSYAIELSEENKYLEKIVLYLQGIMYWDCEIRFREDLMNSNSGIQRHETQFSYETSLEHENEDLKRHVVELNLKIKELEANMEVNNYRKRCFCSIL